MIKKVDNKKDDTCNVVTNRGVVYQFKSKNNCSIRTRIAANLMDYKMKKLVNVRRNRVLNRTFREKENKLKQLTTVLPSGSFISQEYLKNHSTFFTNVSKEMFKNKYSELILQLKLQLRIKLVNKMNIVDDILGAKMLEDANVPVFILCPRDKVLSNTGSSHMDVECLSTLLKKYNKINLRGKKCTGLSNNYTTLGAHCNRYGKGFTFSNIHPDYMMEFNHVKNKILKRVFNFAKQFLPTGLLSSLKEIKQLVGDSVSINGDGDDFDNVWSSLASSCNYVSPAHTDKDAFISCLLVSHKPSDYQQNKKHFYSIDDKVCCHFIFPEYGIAVALRPGDILFFNPLHYHCLSDRTIEYKDEDVYVTSFYMKSSQVGLNDNDIALPEVNNIFL